MRVNYLKNLMLIGFAGLFISCGSTPKNEFAKDFLIILPGKPAKELPRYIQIPPAEE